MSLHYTYLTEDVKGMEEDHEEAEAAKTSMTILVMVETLCSSIGRRQRRAKPSMPAASFRARRPAGAEPGSGMLCGRAGDGSARSQKISEAETRQSKIGICANMIASKMY